MAPLLNLFPPPPEPTIVHPGIPFFKIIICKIISKYNHLGVVTTILQLIPMMKNNTKPPNHQRYSVALQTFSAQLLQSLLRTEKNQQVCWIDFISC